MIDKQTKAAILKDFRKDSQPHQLLKILTSRKKPVSSEVLRTVTPNLSSVIRGQIDRRLIKHGLTVECERVYGGDSLWALREIQA